MIGRVVTGCTALVMACGDNRRAITDAGADDPADAAPPIYDGGSIDLPDCGYRVTTRLGAEAPRPAIPTVGPDPAPMQVHLGIPGDPRTSIAVQWRTRDETTLATTMRYAPGDALGSAALTSRRDGLVFAYDAGGDAYPRIHEVHLCGLTPDTVYSYQVGAGVAGHEAWSQVYSFRTAPDVDVTPDALVRFAVAGDTRGGYDVWADHVAHLLERKPDVVLFTGDAVGFGLEQVEWESFFTRGEPLFARVPLVATNGNHDLASVHFFSQLALPGDEENFGIDYGWAHVTVINDSPEIAGELETRIRSALADDLARSAAARWKLVVHHIAMWSGGQTHGSYPRTQRAFMPLYDEYGVDLDLSGHEHDFELTHPLRWDAAAGAGVIAASTADGTVFEVQGGGGAPLHGHGIGFWTAYSESTFAASIVSVRRDQITLEAFRRDRSPIWAGYTETK